MTNATRHRNYRCRALILPGTWHGMPIIFYVELYYRALLLTVLVLYQVITRCTVVQPLLLLPARTNGYLGAWRYNALLRLVRVSCYCIRQPLFSHTIIERMM